MAEGADMRQCDIHAQTGRQTTIITTILKVVRINYSFSPLTLPTIASRSRNSLESSLECQSAAAASAIFVMPTPARWLQ
jgi:hypothetical protein